MFSTFFRQALRKKGENFNFTSFVLVAYGAGLNGLVFFRDRLNQLNPDRVVEKQEQPTFSPKP